MGANENGWGRLGQEEAIVVYEEACKAMYYFSDWRYKLLTYFLAFAGALALATQWLLYGENPASTGAAAVPFAAGYVVSLVLLWMDYRNMLLIRIAQAAAASVESQWGIGHRNERWSYVEGRASTGFFTAMSELQPLRATPLWTRRQRWSSYTVTLLVWFWLAAIAFAAGFACVVSTDLSVRAAIFFPLVLVVAVVVLATRGAGTFSTTVRPRTPDL